VAVITWNVRSLYPTFSETLRHAFFQVGSIITTTGYATTDFDLWPALSKTLLVTLMFIGACAGSTSGGIKVSRILILLKTIRKELSLIIHPRQVKKIRMDGHPVDHETLRSANVFLVVYFVLLLTSMLLISVDEFDFSTNFTSVVTVLNNIGPGLNLVGPTQNFSIFSPFSKFVLMFDMLAGRLELFPMMILLMPSTWKRK
jgi:trk system potassium uptake protein TrkH